LPMPGAAWSLYKIGIDQTRRGSTGSGSSALSQRREDAIHSFALQLPENVHAHRIARIKHLRVSGSSRKDRRQHQHRKGHPDHLALHRQRCLTPHMSRVPASAGGFPRAKCTLGATPFVFCFGNRISRVRIPNPFAIGIGLIGGTRGATSLGKIAYGRSFQVLSIPSTFDTRFSR